MWLFDRRRFVFGALALLGACGFTPAYGPNGAASSLIGATEIEAPETRETYVLTRHLEERLGRASAPRYGLSYAVTITEDKTAVATDNTALRFNVIGKATYSLRDLATGKVLTSGNVDNFTGYSASGTTVATLTAQRDARERLMIILGDQIITRLISANLS